MGEAKRRKELGVPPREKPVKLPELDKKVLQKKIRSFLYENPIVPFIFYSIAILTLIGGLIYVIKYYKLF